MPTKYLLRERGFTLLEVVFAAAILAIGMMGYTALKVSNRYSWVFAKNLSQAVQLTGSNLEHLWLVTNNGVGVDVANPIPSATYTFNSANPNGIDSSVNSALPAGTPIPVGDTVITAGDFIPSSVVVNVRRKCPTELSTLITNTTNWNTGGPKTVVLTQAQVRQVKP